MKKEETTAKLLALKSRAQEASETRELRQVFEELHQLMALKITQSKKVSAKVDGTTVQWIEETSHRHQVSDRQIRTDILFSIELCLAVLTSK